MWVREAAVLNRYKCQYMETAFQTRCRARTKAVGGSMPAWWRSGVWSVARVEQEREPEHWQELLHVAPESHRNASVCTSSEGGSEGGF